MSITYKRILLKLSGEAFKGSRSYGIDPHFLMFIANEIKKGHELGADIGIVIGGGNIFRGMSASAQGMDRVAADYSGMLATVMNGIALQDALEKSGVSTRLQSSLEVTEIAEPFVLRRALRHFEKNRVVIFCGGTGNPYFTTDTTAALRAAEIKADVILKATQVNGVYDKDPVKYDDAKKFESISSMDALQKELKVMDSTALSLSMDNNIPTIVFKLTEENHIQNIILGHKIGSLVGSTE